MNSHTIQQSAEEIRRGAMRLATEPFHRAAQDAGPVSRSLEDEGRDRLRDAESMAFEQAVARSALALAVPQD